MLRSRLFKRITFFVFIMLVVEYLDELSYSALEVARPLIRDTFALNYIQLGLMTTIPILVATVIEPIVGLFADGHRRRQMIVLGGVLFGSGLILQGFAPTFTLFMIGLIVEAPAVGVFVSIAQASLMDDAPERRENRMALWTFSGSLAVVTGPLLMTLVVVLGQSWRVFFIGSGTLSVLVALYVLRLPPNPALRSRSGDNSATIDAPQQRIVDLLRRVDIWRWLVLLEFSDLMLDVLFSLLALYMVDVVGVTQTQASIAVITWTGVGLIGDFLLIPLLERVKGLVYLRFSALIILLLYPSFLLIETYALKLVVLALMGLFNAGWYAILQGNLYHALGDRSGAVLIFGNIAGVGGALLPALLGMLAQVYGLNSAMWLLVVSPLVLLLGLPRRRSGEVFDEI